MTRTQPSSSPAMTSCCPAGSWDAPLVVPHGARSADSGAGRTRAIGSEDDPLEIYVSRPPSDDATKEATKQKKAILVFTDVYGFQDRLFAICDGLARELDAFVVALDCFRGETKDGHLDDFAGWIRRHPYERAVEDRRPDVHPVGEDVRRCREFLSDECGAEVCAAVGFCWGVWAVAKACAAGVPFQCAVGFHPSLIVEGKAFGMDPVALAEEAAGRTPMLLCVAGNDPENLKPPGGEIAEIVASSNHGAEGSGRRPPECVEFPGMLHGWVSRGDTSVKAVKEDAEKALEMATEFIADWM
ncbi:hypothetical protein ACHAWF_012397 [Thalassiosira exigua]